MIALALGGAWALGLALACLDSRRPAARWLYLVGMTGVFAVLVLLLLTVARVGPVETVTGGWPPELGIRLRADWLGAWFALLTTFVLLVAGASEAFTGVRSRSFLALAALMAAGLNGLFLTGDIFNFYVFFEVSLAAGFGLAAQGDRASQMRAAFTFVVVNLFGSLLFVGAVAGVYRMAGTLEMSAVAAAGARSPQLGLVVGALLLVSLGLKLGLFPFHLWVPPVYRDSDPAVAAILAGALANVGSYGLIRFAGEILPGPVQAASPVLLAFGMASLLYGAVVACGTKVPGEVLAYSSIGQAGYILLAVALGGPAGLAAAVIYATVNSLNKLQLFLALGVRGPLVGFAVAIAAISVAGIPPSAGFFAKAAVFRAAIAAGDPVAVAVIVLGGVLSIVYIFPFYQRRSWHAGARGPSSLPARVLLLGVSLLILAAGLWPDLVLAAGGASASALVGEAWR